MSAIGEVDVVLVDRAMAETTAPTFTEIGPLVGAQGVKLTETLNLPESLEFTVPAALQEDAVNTRIIDPLDGSEVWLFQRETGNKLFAGPFLGYRPQLQDGGIVWTIRASGILGYTARMLAPEPTDADLVFTAEDQADIAAALIDYWQALDYGDYGIDTSSVGATGVARDRTYAVPELHIVAQRLAELAAVADGFDYSIDPTTREFVVHYPSRGGDKTSTVIIDARSIIDPQSQISVGPEDTYSDAFAISSDTGLVATASSSGLRSSFGRSAFSAAWSGISVQATLDDHAQRLLDQHDSYLHILGATSYPIGIGWNSFELGDLVEFSFNYGAGDVTEQRRILQRTLTLAEPAETITVSLL